MIPATRVVHRLLDHATPGLRESGELEQVRHAVERTLEYGNGAVRQRNAFARGGPEAVVDELTHNALR